MKTSKYSQLTLLLVCTLSCAISLAQPITGVWKGKIKSTRVELKLVRKGDSVLGTSYYYTSRNNYRRYSVKGYFDDLTSNVVWWDDALIEDKSAGGIFGSGSEHAMLTVANFNCPGEGVMKLDGKTSLRDDKNTGKGPINLLKGGVAVFTDEWNFVLDNYLLGANDPSVIDSIAGVAFTTSALQDPAYIDPPADALRHSSAARANQDREPVIPKAPVILVTAPAPQSVEEKFSSRNKILEQVIPLAGDSIALSFYDNAEIDGDSIALFLNGNKIFQHVMLTDRPYTVKFATVELQDDNEAVMVAENLGSIPPNTALMIAMVGGKRYEAHLYSTENSSALIRFVKEPVLKKGN